MDVTGLRAGTTFKIDNTPYVVLKYTHTKLGRGGATIRVSARNLKTGSIEKKTFKSGGTVEAITTQKKRLKFLYQGREAAVFVGSEMQEEVEIGRALLGEQAAFLKKGQEVDALFWEDTPLSVEIAPKVTLAVTETAPGVRGDSATNVYKPATLENGLKIKVPLFVKAGDRVVVDTRTGEYVERAK